MSRSDTDPLAIAIPLGYPTAMIYVDESGSKSSGSRFFVMGAVKLRNPGRLAREVQAVRERTGFDGEFKFSEITKGSLVAYYGLIEAMEASDARLGATVVNRDRYDPFPGKPTWAAHAEVAARLIAGTINRRELASAVLDGISTPQNIAFDDVVRVQVNRQLRATALVTAVCVDSKANDGLQMADLVASAIAHERRRAAGENRKAGANPNSPKTKVARRLMESFLLDNCDDQRTDRVTIVTMRGSKAASDRIGSRLGDRVNHARRSVRGLEVVSRVDDTA